MSFCLILLAAGESKRFNSKIPKPFIKVGEKTILEHSLIKFSKIKQIKKTLVVINKKHTKFLKEIKSNNFLKVIGGKTRQESTYNALKYIKKNKLKCTNVLIHDSARPNFSLKLIRSLLNPHISTFIGYIHSKSPVSDFFIIYRWWVNSCKQTKKDDIAIKKI